MKANLVFLLTFLVGMNVIAQTAKTEKRIEIEFDSDFKRGGVFSFGKDGFLLISQSKNKEDNTWVNHFTKYDQNLEKKGEVTNEPQKKYFALLNTKKDTKLYYISSPTKIKENRPFDLTTYDFEKETVNTINGSFPKKFAGQTAPAIIGDYFVFAALVNRVSTIIAVNINSGEVKMMPVSGNEINAKKFRFLSLQVSDDGDELIALYSAYSKRVFSSHIFIYDNELLLKDHLLLNQGREEIINTAKVTKTGNNEYVVTGTYGMKTNIGSSGLFFAIVDNEIVKSINYYNFTKFDKFLDYLSDKSQDKLNKKIEKAEAKGKEVFLNYNITSHSIIKVNNEFLYLGEAYYPVYHTEQRTSFVNGKSVTTYVRVFDGYQYTHAVFAKFNEEGEMVWDQSFPLSGLGLSMYVKHYIKVATGQQNNLNFVYASSREIYNKVVDYDGKVISEKSSSTTETGNEDDKVKYAHQNIDFWYDNYFLAYGEQTIKNTSDEDVKRKRTVFFVNKIKF